MRFVTGRAALRVPYRRERRHSGALQGPMEWRLTCATKNGNGFGSSRSIRQEGAKNANAENCRVVERVYDCSKDERGPS